MPRAIKLWTGVPLGLGSIRELDDLRTPFVGTGLRVPLGAGRWAAVDLPTADREPFARMLGADFLISISWRSLRMAIDSLSALSVTPSAGNSLTVRIGNASHDACALVVVPVTASHATASGAHNSESGDPLGEAALDLTPRETTNERCFEIDYGGVSSVYLALQSSPEAELVLHVHVCDKTAQETPKSYQSLSMFVQPHAANLISLCFREHTASRRAR